MEYIHYGHKRFDRTCFEQPLNRPYSCKPTGGLWASPVNAEYGWKEWCTAEDFCTLSEDNSFRFALKDGAKVYHVWSTNDVKRMPQLEDNLGITTWALPDFEQLIADGYDAVELHLSEETGEHGITDGLYFLLYGWDCDSILVLSPDVVEEI